jgi:uncharacterized protein YqgC (DUF456 family)
MDTLLVVLAVLAGLVGIIGSVAPGLPGPPLSWVGLLLSYFAKGTNGAGETMSLKFLLIWLGITIVVSILDYVVPAYFTKLTGGSKYASWGAIIGLFVGMFFSGVGVILGSLLGAFLFELAFAGKTLFSSAKSAVGAFLGFIFGTGLKLMASGLMMYYIIVYI